ncbi:unnamed protein product [Camellia sinensis]
MLVRLLEKLRALLDIHYLHVYEMEKGTQSGCRKEKAEERERERERERESPRFVLFLEKNSRKSNGGKKENEEKKRGSKGMLKLKFKVIRCMTKLRGVCLESVLDSQPMCLP